MITFKPITADNILEAAEYFKYKSSRTSDYSMGAMYMWRDFYNTTYTIYDDMLLYKVKFMNRTSFTYPVGGGSFEKAIDALKEYCNENDIPMWFCTVPIEVLPTLKEKYHGTVPCTPSRDWADYLYNAVDLAEMAGRRFSGQRNHINKFKKLYPDYKYQRITSENLPRVMEFLKDYEKKHGKEAALAKEEFSLTLEMMPYLEKFKLPGFFYMTV
jgi:hypothetical protein